MAGIPVVVMDPSAVGLGHQYWEIGELITPGVDCLLVHNAAEAQAALRSLLTDDALAARIGAAGRAAAIRHFGWSRIAPEWAAVLGGSDTARQSG
jgi:glycosyltransferase involved in cell wall biosynthesis